MHTRGVVKASGFTKGVCKASVTFSNFKGSPVGFLENKRS